jgi:large subunit ribosomal protein L18
VSEDKRLQKRRQRRKFRVRNKFCGHGRPRVSVFRSTKHIYAQIIDDDKHNTVASFSSQKLKDFSGDKKAIAKAVGIELSKLAKDKSVEKVFFDRGSFRYLGRLKALAEGLREGGLEF